jgi:exonuclease V gamma subunit
MGYLAILLQDACPQPLADQVQKSSINDSLCQHPLQPFPPELVKETYDTLPTSETFHPKSG